MAGKNKSKTIEEDKQFKIAESVFNEYEDQLKKLFKFFSKKGRGSSFGVEDITLEVEDMISLFRKCEILEDGILSLEDVISSIEKYYQPISKLSYKLTNEQFQLFIKNNPLFLSSRQKERRQSKTSQDVTNEETEEEKKHREENEFKEAEKKWRKQVIS